MRRVGVGTGLCDGAAPAWTPARLDPAGWWRADLGVTLAGGEVSEWADQGATAPALNFSQGTVANQPTFTSTVAALGNRAAVTASTNSDWMGAGAAGDVDFLHSGAGATIALVARPTTLGVTQYLLASQGASLTAVGFALYVQNTNAVHFVTGNGAASPVSMSSSSSLTVNTAFLLEVEYATASTPDVTMCLNRAAVGTANEAVAPVALASATPLRLGTASAGFAFLGDYAEILILDRVWTSAERTRFRDYVSARYGI